jgi:hypothetical protein
MRYWQPGRAPPLEVGRPPGPPRPLPCPRVLSRAESHENEALGEQPCHCRSSTLSLVPGAGRRRGAGCQSAASRLRPAEAGGQAQRAESARGVSDQREPPVEGGAVAQGHLRLVQRRRRGLPTRQYRIENVRPL